MSKADRILLLHYLGFQQMGSVRFGLAAKVHPTLTSAQRQQLRRYVKSMEDHLRSKRWKMTGVVLLEVACLAMLVDGAHSDAKSILHGKNGNFTAEKLETAAQWASLLEQQLAAIERLPPSVTASLHRHARQQKVDLPRAPTKDPVQFLAGLSQLTLLPSPSYRDPLKELLAAYRSLSLTEARELARTTIDIWKEDPDATWSTLTGVDVTEEILIRLASLVPGSLRGLHLDLIPGTLLLEGELFRDADSKARDQLLHQLEAPPHDLETLFALAWIDDPVVRERFHRWRQSPPAWRPDIAATFAGISRGAGWELTETGDRRQLYRHECYQLLPRKGRAGPDRSGPVEVVTSHDQQCGWCGRPLWTMFDIDLTDTRLSFLAPGWKRLRIAMCKRCTCYESVYTDVDGNGSSRWSSLNVRPDYIGTDESGWNLMQRRLVLGPRRRSPFEAHPKVLHEGESQLGGFPSWVQGTSHPDCPKCRRLMVFVGQIATTDALGEIGEGVYYAFLCQDCRIAATTYEQT